MRLSNEKNVNMKKLNSKLKWSKFSDFSGFYSGSSKRNELFDILSWEWSSFFTCVKVNAPLCTISAKKTRHTGDELKGNTIDRSK